MVSIVVVKQLVVVIEDFNKQCSVQWHNLSEQEYQRCHELQTGAGDEKVTLGF